MRKDDVERRELSHLRLLIMHIPKHKRLMKQCGIRMAALYLRNRGYTAEQAVSLLLR